MHSIFRVSTEDIKNLTDTQARELISRLCRAELRAKGLSEAFVTWGGDQRAADGGVDVRVKISPETEMNGYIPKSSVIYQVKAENFPSSKITKEMMFKGALRPTIVELASINGTYIIVSTKDDTSDSSLKDRKQAMLNCLISSGLKEEIHLDFYDCRKIADWVEQHPAIFYWVNHVLNKPLFVWRTYTPWAYREDNIDAEYILDNKVKVFIPNSDEGISITNAIDELRMKLKNNVSIRIVGLSGVGKTRLVQALFDDRIGDKDSALDPNNVLYTDLSDNPTPQPNAMAEALFSAGSDSIIIVDNCGADTHQKLTGIIKKTGNKLRLITIEYDIREDYPEDTSCYRLESSSEEVIKQLLKRKYPQLSDPDIDKINEFSDGNARVALALASSSETKGELARLGDADLFKRLFIQKNSVNEDLLKVAEVASLLYSFNFDDVTPNSEMAILAGLAETTILSFSRNSAELKKRGLIQERGNWRAVLPHAIANRLALSAIEAYPKEHLIEALFDKAPERVARSFSRRLGYLHESSVAREVIATWLSASGPYGDLTKLSPIQRDIFSNIAPVNQLATLEALQRAIESSDFVAVTNHNRHYFARVARSLAYESVYFDKAVRILIKFSIVEAKDYKSNSVTEMLESLFYCHLSGTEASADQRAKIINELKNSSNINEYELGLTLLQSALKANHFTSHYDFGFGARKRGYGWYPKTPDEVIDWYRPFISIITEYGLNTTIIGKRARNILGQQMPDLFGAGLVEELIDASNKLAKIDGFPDGWHAVRRAIHFYKADMPPEILAKLNLLETQLKPNDLEKIIRAKVLTRDSLEIEIDRNLDKIEEVLERVRVEVQNLGKALSDNKQLLIDMLPDFLQPHQGGNLGPFSFSIGKTSKSIKEILGNARNLINDADSTNINITFILGLISGWHTVSPNEVSDFLDEAIEDVVWAKWFPILQFAIVLDNPAYDRLIKSLAVDKASIWQLTSLGHGRASDPLSITQIANLINSISDKPDGGLNVAIDVLHMVVFISKEKDEDYRFELSRYCASFLLNFEWFKLEHDNHNLVNHLSTIIEFAVQGGTSESEVFLILEKLLNYELDEGRGFTFKHGEILKPFFEFYPRITLDSAYKPDEDGSFRSILRLISTWSSDREETAIDKVPNEALITWCNLSPDDRYIFAAQTCRLFTKSTENGKQDLYLSDIAKQIFINSNNKKTIVEIYLSRFVPHGWSGNLSQILRLRLSLIDQLSEVEDEEIRNQLIEAKTNFINRIENEEKREEENERKRTGSFE